MDIGAIQARLAAVHLYDGKADGDAGPLTRAAVTAFVLQQGVRDFEAWPAARQMIAAQQLIRRLDGIEVGATDGRSGPQTRHAIGMWDARAANGGKPDPAVEAWRDDAAAPQAVQTRLLLPINSSRVAAPSARPVWPKQSGMDAFYGKRSSAALLIDA